MVLSDMSNLSSIIVFEVQASQMSCSHNTSNLMMSVEFVKMFSRYVCHDVVGRFLFILLRRLSVLQHICESLSIYVFGQITCTLLVMKCMNEPL